MDVTEVVRHLEKDPSTENCGRILRQQLRATFGPLVARRIAEFFSREENLMLMHCAIEDHLCELRDAGIGVVGPANGWVIRHADGQTSCTMRIGTRDGLRFIMNQLKESAE